MDTYSPEYSRILHNLIIKFISMLKDYVNVTSVEKSKVFFEVIKRSFSISQGIKLIALNALTNETADKTVSDSIISRKVKDLLDIYLQQDLMECAVNSGNMIWKNVSDDDLYESLYVNSISDKNTMASTVTKLRPTMSMGDLQSYYSANLYFTSSKTTPDLDCLILSSQFDQCKIQFEEDLSRLKSTLRNGSPSLDFKNNDGCSKSSCDLVGDSRSTFSNESHDLDGVQPTYNSTNWLMFANSQSSDNDFYQRLFRDSWEGKMKQFVPCHLYTSELNSNEALLNVTDEDSPLFRCIYDTSSLSEDALKHDILDLLIAIPSDTFVYDNNKRMFLVNSHVHMDKLSHESSLRFLEKFVDAGNMFHKLQLFSKELSYYEDGLILRGLKLGIQQVLNLYTEYIMGVKVKKPSLQFLRTDVLEAAQSLNILGSVCKIEIENNNPGELHKGLGLLSYLKESLWSIRSKENIVMIGVILKYVYTPYFRFLEKWMDEGICYDPYSEFQILEDFKYLNREDELYWKFAYTENSEDPMRVVPNEIKLYAADILKCGKNMRLLKICCSSNYSLEYMLNHPPPSLSVLFSDCAARIKEEMCFEYIKRKEEYELEYSVKKKLSDDYVLVQNQSYITQREVFILNKVWCNRFLSHSLMQLDCSSVKNVHINERSKSWENLPYLHNTHDEIIFDGVGILFTTCIFIKVNTQSDEPILQEDENDIKPLLLNKKIYCDTNQVSKSNNAAIHLQQSQVSNNVSNNTMSKSLIKFPSPVPDDILPGTFMDSLASLLISDCCDRKEDIYSCLQLSSLQSIMTYNFKAGFDMRMHIVKKAVKDYFMNQLKLEDLLIGLKNTYLLLDESFSQLLCEKLFPWTLMCQNTQQFANWSILNEIFCNSLTESNCASSSLLSTGTVIFVDLPENDILERNEFLHFFQFEFQINWPMNIIVHKSCITQYRNINSFLLELDFLSWLLGNTWESLMLGAKSSNIQDSSQYRAIMLQRFDMHQFICVLRNCIRHDLQGPVWDFLLKSLSTEELSIDALENIHIQYLKSVSTRCFLTKETEILHDMVKVMLHIIYKFCIWALNCDWEINNLTKQYETAEFCDLTSMTETYKKYEVAFFERLIKMTVTRKYGVTNDDGSKRFLEIILESRRKCL